MKFDVVHYYRYKYCVSEKLKNENKLYVIFVLFFLLRINTMHNLPTCLKNDLWEKIIFFKFNVFKLSNISK